MAEISKWFKWMLIVDVVIGVIYGVLYVFFPDVVYNMNDAPFYDPHFWRLFGGAILAIGVGAALSLKVKDWEKVKLFILIVLIFLVIIAIVNITSALYTTRSPVNLGYHWLDTSLILILIVLNGYFYLREGKK
ncbi:MAG: hypothetical protein ACFFKA_12840 [Candidatus Thorarchaeota archaeon]